MLSREVTFNRDQEAVVFWWFLFFFFSHSDGSDLEKDNCELQRWLRDLCKDKQFKEVETGFLVTRFLKTAEGRGLPSESALGVLREWWSSRVLLNCFTKASCKEASRRESEVNG